MSNSASRIPEGLTVMSREPLVAGTSLEALEDLLPPATNFFIRNHFPIPHLKPDDWNLSVTGEVEMPSSYALNALKQMPRKELLALMECAGNSRASVQPPIEGLL